MWIKISEGEGSLLLHVSLYFDSSSHCFYRLIKYTLYCFFALANQAKFWNFVTSEWRGEDINEHNIEAKAYQSAINYLWSVDVDIDRSNAALLQKLTDLQIDPDA